MILTFTTPTLHAQLIFWFFIVLEIILLCYQIFNFYRTSYGYKSGISCLILASVLTWNGLKGYDEELPFMVFINIMALSISIVLGLMVVFRLLVNEHKENSIPSKGDEGAENSNDPFTENCHFYQLSPREIEIVQLIRKGLTYRAIAESLHISESTVDTHMQNVYTKVGERGKIALLNKLDH